MSDKKKKVFTSKETLTPRRPVILKSDRDVSKDQTKEKQEKEKAPTIILKTREQSAPKDDRPVSPKTLKSSTSEIEGIHPSKIAQNENKEKKEQKPNPPLKLMTDPVKLLDENLEFNNAALEFLNDSNTNYLIVGVIGTQGVGKSMVLNLISQNKHIRNLCSYILNSHEMSSENTYDQNDTSSLENQLEALNFVETSEKNYEHADIDFKFKMQDIAQIEKGIHCTKGVDMFVTTDRVILLDCQALFSPSLIEEFSASPVTARSANVVTVDCLQVASFLMSVCHVLVAVQDWFSDYNLLRCQLEDFTPEAVKTMQDLYRKSFQKSSLQLNSGMYMYSDSNKNGLNMDSVCKGHTVDNCGPPINLFLLPEVYSDYDNREVYRGHPPFEQLAKRLRWMIFGVNRHQITNVPNLSEKGWFQYCSKAWETIRKCTFFMEYERFLP
ncbi:unnamed protein product [Chilo suppressalis]|uniref:Protein SMG9 n=1 Tax=Chilo suppressalis TaxID=168631 RepID=A0ABN8L8G5_CHISP|nr:unnamed protein product [Chilo suppressalis]